VSLTVTQGERATFTVGAAGDAPLRYQWAFGGQSISGATEDRYTIDQVTLAHAGSYSVTVSNAVASVESTAGTLTVTSSSGGGCEPGSTSTAWASSCPTKAATACTPGNARIEDHARVLSGSVSSGTVGGLTVLSGFRVATSGTVRTSFYPLGFFESGQGLSGSASLVGDVEFRGQGYDRSSGTCSGFVDAQTCEDAAEVTVAPPYQWRP